MQKHGVDLFVLLLLFIICTGYVEVIAVENERTTSTSTASTVVDAWVTQSSHKLPVTSPNFASNNELPKPTPTRRFDADDSVQYGRTTSHGEPASSRYRNEKGLKRCM